MNNEIGRKLTSLTLMTIMLASAFSAFAPSAIPEAAAANANLYVSAENSQFQNYFAGPQVIEVVVIDSDLKDTDKGKGEPDVTINGNKLRMIQATDGNWYGYFADRDQALKADAVAAAVGLGGDGKGLDFGSFCSAASGGSYLGFSVTQTSGIAIPVSRAGTATLFYPDTNGNIAGGAITNGCSTDAAGLTGAINRTNVVRESKTPNGGTADVRLGTVPNGQLGLNSTSKTTGDGGGTTTQFQSYWPFIQLYQFSAGGNIVVQYNKGGGIQKTTLTFDTIPSNLIGLSLDKANYPKSAQVHTTMTDPQLNIDPTDEDSWTFGTVSTNATLHYQLFDENGARDSDGNAHKAGISGNLTTLMFEKNGVLKLDRDAQVSGTNVVTIDANGDSLIGNTVSSRGVPMTLTEQGINSGIFGTYDEQDDSVLEMTSTALRGTSASIQYNDKSYSIVAANYGGTINFDEGALGGEWNSGEEISISLVDGDQNLNGRLDEDLDVFNANTTIPAIRVGAPLTLANSTGRTLVNIGVDGAAHTGGTVSSIDTFSDRVKVTSSGKGAANLLYINVTTSYTGIDLSNFIRNASTANGGTGNGVYTFLQYDLRSFANDLSGATIRNIGIGNATNPEVWSINATSVSAGFDATDFQDTINLGTLGNLGTGFSDSTIGGTREVILEFIIDTSTADTSLSANTYPITADFIRFGINNDGSAATDRFNDAIYRLELEETGDNTATFIGSVEYIMLNQINVNQTSTYASISSTDDEVVIIVGEDLTDEDSVRTNFNDVGGDGSTTQIADQVEAPTHSGVVSFDASTYKSGDTVTVTLQDQDLNVDSDLIDIYTTVTAEDFAADTVGKIRYGLNSQSEPRSRLLDITFDDQRWLNGTKRGTGTVRCTDVATPAMASGLGDSGFTLIETGGATGTFTGSFLLPAVYCARGTTTGTTSTTQGTDIEVNYVDFRDASGEIVEVGDGAGIRSNTGSVSLDRTVYPVPWGVVADLSGSTTGSPSANGFSVFPIHKTSLVTNTATGATENVNTNGETLGDGDIILHVQINDPDFNTSATGEDKIREAGDVAAHGPVKVVVSRGASSVILASAGAPAATGNTGRITVGTDTVSNTGIAGTGHITKELGPITETAPDSGIFEFDVTVRYTDGPSSSICPTTTNFVSANNSTRFTSETARFSTSSGTSAEYCILQGDIVTVTYRDPADSAGQANTVTDSATFDLRNGAIQSDKSVYIIGSDMILTIIEPDWDRDNDSAETYDLDIIEWDSDAATITMGNLGGDAASFDPEPSDFRETGDSTGIFQVVIEIPADLGSSNNKLERGEEIVLEYTDWSPSGADFVGQENEDVNLTLFTSNFGATVELDQKVYTWTDKVYITVIAPDHNFDSNLIDTVGDTSDDPVKVATRGHKLDEYHLTESGTDTGIFTGEVILTGFAHDADGKTTTGTATNGFDAPNFTGRSSSDSASTDLGPTNGFIQADDDDGLTVSFEFSEDETVVGSALIRWNIGEVSWLEASYPATGVGVVRIIDPDMNIHPEAIDNFAVDAWSDSDAGGIDLTVTETNEASGIFEGTVYFTTTDESSGSRLRVAEGDTVTAEYQDNTLPSPYTSSDELDITGTAFIGTVVPPLERAPASNARVVDAFGNSLDEVSLDQQVQITADLINGQDREQAFAYLVQIQDENSVTVSLAWITGSLAAGQSFSPALSWIPAASGTYTATVFVWESVDNPTALSPPVSVDITVS